MSGTRLPPNRVRELRKQNRWAQIELAAKSGLSRTAISAIEGRRLVPSVAAALALGRVFGCTVEDLFGSPAPEPKAAPEWAWPVAEDSRWWAAEVNGQVFAFPVEDSPTSFWPHDGRGDPARAAGVDLARKTLVIATCDPAAGLLAKLLWDEAGVRLLVYPRSSSAALSLLRERRVHAAGIHLGGPGRKEGNARAAAEVLGEHFALVPVGQWQAGLALGPAVSSRSMRTVLTSRLTWIGREPGSGGHECLKAVLGDRSLPRRTARDHRGVVEAILSGWADVGVSLRWLAEDAGLRFISVREENYDLCLAPETARDSRWLALARVMRSAPCRQLLAALPGYKPAK